MAIDYLEYSPAARAARERAAAAGKNGAPANEGTAERAEVR
jgi:hypothetical protein